MFTKPDFKHKKCQKDVTGYYESFKSSKTHTTSCDHRDLHDESFHRFIVLQRKDTSHFNILVISRNIMMWRIADISIYRSHFQLPIYRSRTYWGCNSDKLFFNTSSPLMQRKKVSMNVKLISVIIQRTKKYITDNYLRNFFPVSLHKISFRQ